MRDFVALVQCRFLLNAARLGLLPEHHGPGLPEGLAAWRTELLERHPGFRETLMGWEVPPPSAGSDLDGSFSAEEMGRCYEAFLGREARRKQGSFYTERDTIRRLLEGPLRAARPRMLDPAMGCGAFLAEALAMRGLAAPEARWSFACDALFGVDRDSLAREIAVLALWLQIGHAAGDPRRLQQNLRLGNSLLPPQLGAEGLDWDAAFPDVMREGGFTAVVGNPPFINIERLNTEEKRLYREAFPDLTKRFDLFVPMAEKALDLTRPGGDLALLLPQAFLSQAYAEPIRRRFLEQTTLSRLEMASFPGAAVRTVLLSARKEPPAPEHRIAILSPEQDAEAAACPAETLPQAPLLQLPEARIPARGGAAFARAKAAFERGTPLGAVAFATWGVRGVPIAEFHRDRADHPACRPMLKGEGIDPYRARWDGKYLRYEPERLYRPLFPELFEREKIVLRKVSGRRGLIAAIDRAGHYTDDSVLCCQLRSQLSDLPEALVRRYGGSDSDPALEGYDLPVLLAILNSRIGGQIFELLLGNGLNVYPAAVMRMPLPPVDAERFAAIRDLVARREAALPSEARAIERDLEGQVEALYGLVSGF